MLPFDDWCKTLSTRVQRQPSKRVKKQDTWLVWEDDRKIHQEVRKADYHAHAYSSPERDRNILYPKIDSKVFETNATTVRDGNAWTKLKLD
uniref:Uncharacterized protein n=1 Tax=Caenorhabditis japonica TaxID=281687 RepID=A0A8R1EBK5_CAEJA